MDHRLRPRDREMFYGFTKGEIEKMEKLLKESGEQLLNQDSCQKLTKGFNRSSGRAGKPVLKWMEVHDWFQRRQQDVPKIENRMSEIPRACPSNKSQESSQNPPGEKIPDLSELEFEARSSKDGAWYDVDMFITHRFLITGEAEVRVRFVGFGAEEDEWVNIKQSVRERSVPLEHSECQKLKNGDLVLCFQERRDQAIYYDAHIVEIQRRMHDIRGCRCLFTVRYDHDSTELSISSPQEAQRPMQVLRVVTVLSETQGQVLTSVFMWKLFDCLHLIVSASIASVVSLKSPGEHKNGARTYNYCVFCVSI